MIGLNIQDAASVRLEDPRLLTTEGRVFYTRKLCVTDTKGGRTTITLFSDDKETLLFDHEKTEVEAA